MSTEKPFTIPFGPYAGRTSTDVPASYLVGLVGIKQVKGQFRQDLTDNLDALKARAASEGKATTTASSKAPAAAAAPVAAEATEATEAPAAKPKASAKAK